MPNQKTDPLVCARCRIRKTVEEFQKDRHLTSGIRSACKLCRSTEASLRYRKDRIRLLEQTKRYAREHRAERLTYQKRHYLNNKEKICLAHQKWHAGNKESVSLRKRNWRQENKGLSVEKTRRYVLRKKQQMPLWVKGPLLKEIQRIYKQCPVGYRVDHIVPLKGKDVRGSHVPWNLQYLLAHENIRKGNKL